MCGTSAARGVVGGLVETVWGVVSCGDRGGWRLTEAEGAGRVRGGGDMAACASRHVDMWTCEAYPSRSTSLDNTHSGCCSAAPSRSFPPLLHLSSPCLPSSDAFCTAWRAPRATDVAARRHLNLHHRIIDRPTPALLWSAFHREPAS
jgi:hypothetical protein